MVRIHAIFCLLLLHVWMLPSAAQTISRSVIGSAGASSISGSYQLSATVGETVTPTLISGSFVLNQGFQQADPLFNLGIDDELGITVGYKVFPNPSHDWVKVEMETDKPVELILEILDLRGRKTSIKSRKIHLFTSADVDFDLSKLAEGTYTLVIRAVSGELGRSFRIRKM